MKLIIILFLIAGVIILSSCKDVGTNPPPASGFSVKFTVKNTGGTAIAGLRISAWNHLSPNLFRGSQTVKGIHPSKLSGTQLSNSPLSSSQIEFSAAGRARVNLSVFECDGSPVSTLVDRVLLPGRYSVQWDIHPYRSVQVYYYRLIAKDTATAVTLFRDSLFAVFWAPDPEVAMVGWTSSAGTFTTSDKQLFPNVLELPALIFTAQTGPDSLSTFQLLDTVTVALTDTSTHRQMLFDCVIKKGVVNDIQLVWNPTLSLQEMPHPLPMDEQQATVRTNRQERILFTWKLYQSYPNPFN
jgi:hypothetical protein